MAEKAGKKFCCRNACISQSEICSISYITVKLAAFCKKSRDLVKLFKGFGKFLSLTVFFLVDSFHNDTFEEIFSVKKKL